MKNSYKFPHSNFFESKHLDKTLTTDNTYLYSINYAILFKNKRDCQNFLKKIKKNGFSFASRNANLFRIAIVNANLELAINNANKFLEIAKSEESEILTNFYYN